MNHSVIKGLSNIWLASLVIASLGFILGLFISVYGIPGKDYDTILAVCWGSLLIALIFLNITYVAGFSYDIEQRNS